MTNFLVVLVLVVVGALVYSFRRGLLTNRRQKPVKTAVAVVNTESGFELPVGYCFHPGHTWSVEEGNQHARVGIDSFASRLFGAVDGVEVVGLSRWVRQGNRICSITREGTTVNLMSPVEGVVVAVNQEVLDDPSLIAKDPYKNGWICVVKALDLGISKKNLLPEGLVNIWMQNAVRRLQGYATALGAASADGGMPIEGLLVHVDPEVQREMIREFFLN